ncbi:hypothetical protein SRHO_G00103250 [Serrasalmus rhombeus]
MWVILAARCVLLAFLVDLGRRHRKISGMKLVYYPRHWKHCIQASCTDNPSLKSNLVEGCLFLADGYPLWKFPFSLLLHLGCCG